MSGRYNLVKEFIIKPIKNLVKGKKTSKTITSTTPNVGNLKFNQDIKNKLIKTTDAYVTKAGSVDPSLKEALRKAGSKSLQGDKIVRKRNKKSKEIFKTAEGKKDGGRMGLKRGGGKFPDHSGDGKITQKDILMAKGVIPKTKKKSKTPMDKAVRKA